MCFNCRWYVHTLEQVVIDTLAESPFQVATHRSPHTGVWVESTAEGGLDKKVCAMGVHSKDLITSHGLALNCDVDLTWFSHIVPCGIPDKGVTSLTEVLDTRVTTDSVLPHLVRHFERNFKCSVREESESKDSH